MNSVLPVSVAVSEESVNSHFTTFSPNPAVNAAIHDLLALGFSPLPVAPAFPVEQYPSRKNPDRPRFNGKNPSRLDLHGKPHEVTDWKKYERVLPTEAELREWFAHPDTRLGQIAVSVDGTRRVIDLDRKDFDSDAHFERVTQPLVDMATALDKTPGGGVHLTCEFPSDPLADLGKQQMNIGLGDVDHAGELPQFIVCPPTPGYERVKAGPPLKVGSLSELGIRPTKKATPPAETTPPPAPSVAPTALPVATQGKAVALTELASKKVQELLKNLGKDRSDGLTKIARELYGWENLATAEGIALLDSADSILAAVATDNDLDGERATRILATLNRENCEPAMVFAADSAAAVNYLRKLAGLSVEAPTTTTNDDDIEIQDTDNAETLVFRHLYEGKPYVNIQGALHLYTGNDEDGYSYPLQDERAELKRISDLLERCTLTRYTKQGVIVSRPWAVQKKKVDAYKWALDKVRSVKLSDVNPPGLNLKNGILTTSWDSEKKSVSITLKPHSPKYVYVDQPTVRYDENASTEHVDRLLLAVREQDRKLLLQTYAAALDLPLVRKKKGRAVKTLFLCGEGANGKDSLRECYTMILGKSAVSSVGIQQFKMYDEGRMFGVRPLAVSKANISSENNTSINIDNLQSLKQATTGDPMFAERKHQDAEEFSPRCILIFHTNELTPNLTATHAAQRGRYGIVQFEKVFVDNPKKPNELKADPRFKNDPQWVSENVCPALLNYLISGFKEIFATGIDYSPLDETMEKTRIENNHLYRFANECNLIQWETGWVSNAVIEAHLRGWYQDEGVLKVDDNGRESWAEDWRAGDPWVKSTPQYKKRFTKIFPELVAEKRDGVRGLAGIRFASHAEIALRQVATFQDYCKIVEIYGKAEVDKAWQFLTPEQQKTITDLAPTTTTETAEISDNNAALQAAILIEAVADNELEALAHFETFSKEAKAKIWAAIPESDRPAVTALAEKYKAQKAGGQA